jgi:uncharacterized protein
MSLKQRIDADIKAAMLRGDKFKTDTLRVIKSAVLYAEVASGKRESGLTDDEILGVLSKEAKKRQESIDLYNKAGEAERAANETQELAIISEYLPVQISDDELRALVDEVLQAQPEVSMAIMGKVIAAVKERAGAGADGGRIAALVKEKLA